MLTPTGIGLGIGLLLATTALVGYLTTPKVIGQQFPTMTATPATSSSLENTSATKIQSLFREHSARKESPSDNLSTEKTGASVQTRVK
ncbi:MAG: hypothetical protein HON78_04560 [Legionellales bacterium]|jgi:hypothetical protein|nr:hypothetical protein [Legionellales bacterium]